jgi:DNA-binding response OmpR family regulator
MDKKKILVIDDEPAIHKLLKVILEDEGFQIVGSGKPLSTAQSILGGKPDLIILDIMMPEVNGFDILKMLKEDEETRNIPVIVLTVRNLKADVDKAMSLGANCYMTKPFEPAELIDNVNRLLSG